MSEESGFNGVVGQRPKGYVAVYPHEHDYQPSPLVVYLAVAFEGINSRAVHLELCECGSVRLPPDFAKRFVGKRTVDAYEIGTR